MKITFIKDHLSVASGNSFYKAGAQADLRKGQHLIDIGVARAGWEAARPKANSAGVSPDIVEEVLEDAIDLLDFASMKKSDVVEVAESYGIITAGMNKTQLIEALTEAK